MPIGIMEHNEKKKNTCIIKIPEGEEKEKCRESIFKAIMPKTPKPKKLNGHSDS